MNTTKTYDVIVVGSGIAGLYAALLAAPHRSVLLITKGALEESNTRYAQGGIAVALAEGDSPELHLRDTIAAGDGLCSPDAVSILTREAPDCILDLLRMGVPFDKQGDDLAWTLEAAHTRPRILHAGGDATGASIESTLAAAVRALVRERIGSGIDVREGALCTSFHVTAGHVGGVELLSPSGDRELVRASQVILATGGAGQLFSRTTNPSVATGDGVALAYRAGAQLMDLEFMQFHPTALALDGAPSFLISEAVRGEGGILRDRTGYAFMSDYHSDRELAPRDVVARAIHRQMERTSNGNVWLDVTHLDGALIERRFPSILRFCRQWGIDPAREPIPVSPAAHYLMGGVRTDTWGRTSLPGLLACGEVACTGVHGANRLASNSLLEGLVFARRAVMSILAPASAADPRLTSPVGAASIASHLSDVSSSGSSGPSGVARGTTSHSALTETVLDAVAGYPSFRPLLVAQMWKDASLIRSDASLRRVQSLLDSHSHVHLDIPDCGPGVQPRPTHDGQPIARPLRGHAACQPVARSLRGRAACQPVARSLRGRAPVPLRDWYETANLALLARLLVASARYREESRGGHYREDFPERDSAWQRHTVITRDGIGTVPLGTDSRLEAVAGG